MHSLTKYITKYLIFSISLITLLGSEKIFCQEKNIELGITSTLFLTGELNTSYNFTLGTQINYFFLRQKKFNHFATSGFSTTLSVNGKILKTVDLGIGTRYDIIKIYDKPLYLLLSLGALYTNEKFSTQLIDRIVESSFNEFGYKALIGIGYYFPYRINTQLNFSLLNTSTAIGLHIFYNF